MKNIFIVFITLLLGQIVNAQAVTGTTEYAKVPQSAILYHFSHPESIVLDALQNKMSTYKVNAKKVKGFYVYRSVIVPEISSRPINLYFSVEKKSRKDHQNSILSMLIADDKDQFLEITKEPDFFSRGKEFVNSFKESVNTAQHNFEVLTQEKLVEKTAKKVKKIEKEQEDLKKKLKKLEEQLAQNEKDLAAEKATLAKEQALLETQKNTNQ